MRYRPALFFLLVILAVLFMSFNLLVIPQAPILKSPTGSPVSTTPLFMWEKVNDGKFNITYHLQVSRKLDFDSLVIDVPDISDTTFQVLPEKALQKNLWYYWRVNATSSGDDCKPGTSYWSEIWHFITDK